MTEERANEIADIEATQAALRESIEATKELSEDAEILLRRHKRSLERAAEADRPKPAIDGGGRDKASSGAQIKRAGE